MHAEEFAERLPDARKQPGGGFSARCPAHDDRSPSLSFRDGDKGLVVRCHGGCDVESITDAVGLRPRDLFEEATVTPIRSGPRRLVAEYPYTTSKGEVLYTVQRFEPKDFRGKLPAPAERVLYNLPQIKAAKTMGLPIYVVEGEKDAEALIGIGLVATTGCGGAGKWLPYYTSQLAGATEVIVIADDDEPGRKHARQVVASLSERSIPARAVLPAAGCKDISEHLQQGYPLRTVEDLRPLSVEAGDRLRATTLSDVVMTPARWSWTNHFALGALTYLEGDPGVSKSTVTCDLAARWSRGDVMPDGSANPFGGPVKVVLITAEDSLASTVVPRLYAAGARLDNILAVEGGDADTDEPFSLDAHVDRLRADIKSWNAKVVILDPLSAFLGSKVDTFKDSAVRAALLPLSRMAEELGITVLVVRHFNKGTGGKAIHKGGGSIGFIGAARAAFQISFHPEEEGLCIFANAKNNLARKQVSLAYRLVPDEKVKAMDTSFDIARVEWLGASDLDAQDILDAVPGESDQIKAYGISMLAAVEDGPRAWATISECLTRDGFNPRTVERYRGRYLEAVRASGEGNRGTFWQAKGTTSARAGTTPQSTPQALRSSESASDLPTSPLTHDPVDEKGSEAGAEEVCEVCGGGPAVYWPAPHFATRCKTHNPLTGSP